MAEGATTQPTTLSAPIDTATVLSTVIETDAKDVVSSNGVQQASEPKSEQAVVATRLTAPANPDGAEPSEIDADKQTSNHQTNDKSASIPGGDIEMADIKVDDEAPVADESVIAAVDTPGAGDKSKSRRKSGGVPEHKTKKLNKKASKAKMTHIDAKPGDYFYIRLKGYPLWPGIVAAEDMLPHLLLKGRPSSAADADGNYRAEYADGGIKVNQRAFPVMYLFTNEFSWVPNTDLVDLDFDTVGETTKGMKKDLASAHILAAEKHNLDFFRDALRVFQEDKIARHVAEAEAKAAKKAAGAKAKPRSKSISNTVVNDDDEDIEMADAPKNADADRTDTEEAAIEKPKKTKKRKAEEDAPTPSRTDSSKKPKIKLNLTPKATNGAAAPKDVSSVKSAKPKKPKTPKVKEAEALQEPELTPEEKRQKKEKEILFLRHKLQKGLLTRDQEPKEEDMKQMSEFVTKLEGYADLEVSIIRATKINKVLKAILKLPVIPKEDDYQFKPRSQTLLDKWNKLLASESSTPVAGPPINGVKDEDKGDSEEKPAPVASVEANGIKEASDEAEELKLKSEKTPEVDTPTEETTKPSEDASAIEESDVKKTVTEPVPVASTA